MLNKIKTELDRMQGLPHKWWKNKDFKNPKTTPQFDISNIEGIQTRIKLDMNTQDGLYNELIQAKLELLDKHVKLLDRGKDTRKPATLSYIYAINTEILELILELNKSENNEYNDEIRYEMVDIIIFITLLYKHLGYKFKFIRIPYIKTHSFELRSLRNQDHLQGEYILELFGFLLGSIDMIYLESKIVYNSKREDHL